MTGQRRVVVTGLGVASAIGCDIATFKHSLETGACGIAPLQSVDTSHLSFTTGAQISDFDGPARLGTKPARKMDRFSQLAMVSAQQAIDDCGLDPSALANPSCGIVLGTGVGGHETIDSEFETLYKRGSHRTNPLTIPKIMPNAAVGQIAMKFGITGPSFTTCTACSSSNHAIGQAYWMVRSGLVDVAITGGSDAPFFPGNLAAWHAMRVISSDGCRPFSANRDGMTLGEGGGVLVLEDEAAARARGAEIYAEVLGFGMSADAYHLVMPSKEGAARAITAALEDGRIAPETIGYINAHGTGTEVNDRVEASAIHLAIGNRASTIPVSSTKSTHGHGIGAAGALEAVATVLAVRHEILPATVNLDELDDSLNLDIIANEPRSKRPQVALSNSFAFGGLNAVLAFGRYS